MAFCVKPVGFLLESGGFLLVLAAFRRAGVRDFSCAAAGATAMLCEPCVRFRC